MKQNEIINLLIADDHNLFRSGIIKLLKGYKHIRIIGEAENGDELIRKYFELLPDLILADIAMPGTTGLEAVRKIKEKKPDVKAIFLSMHEGDEYIYKAVKSGGSGLINKSILASELVYAIRSVNIGKKYFHGVNDEESLERLVSEFESNKEKLLTNREESINYREIQILDLLKQGLTSQEMADKLNLSKKTIDSYRSGLMQKFNLKSTNELIRFAINFYRSEENLQNSQQN
jgi:two-component system response regulator NreC